MANIKSQIKRNRQNEKRRLRNKSVRAEMRELARMLRQQGDAADEMAETFGRTLARLSVAVENLHARLEALDGAGSEQKVDGQPAEHR